MIKYKVTLTKAERDELETIVSKGTHPVSKVKDAMILLSCDEGENATKYPNKVISDITRVSMKTIDRVKKKFVEEGFEAVMYPGKSKRVYHKKFDGDLEARLVALCCSEAPEGYARWSLRLLADKMVELEYVDEISHESIRQILKKTNLSLGRHSGG
jgi:transposase